MNTAIKVDSSETFEKTEGLAVIIESSGGYKQVDVYTKGGVMYAKNGSCFITLKCNRNTSKNTVRWVQFVLTDSADISYIVNPLGFLEISR